ncbi:MAG: phytanoyl-CoA dioxygenase family protein [Acidimicrobiia bacterium]|nr:phytanoyl-CoA dioxygenase family protein [Acidimicrobiia bacterium]
MTLTFPLDQDETAHYRREGWLLVKEILGAEDLAELDRAVGEVAQSALSGGEAAGHIELEPADTGTQPAVRRILHPYERHPAFRSIAHDPRIVDRVESLLGPDLDLQHGKLNWKPARVGSPVEWHQDLGYYPHTNDGVLAVLIYIDDATEANGCVQVLSRRHREYLDHGTPGGDFAGRIAEQVLPDVEPRLLPAPAGSAIFLHGLTPHASLPNRSHADRRTLIFAYRAGDAYPLFYGTRTVDDEAAPRPVRGERARHARFGGPPPIVPRIDGTSSLYDLQAGSAAPD